MPTKKQISLIMIFMLILIIGSSLVSNWVSAFSPDYYHEIQKNIDLFGRVYQEIAKKYVEEVDPSEFMHAGIDGMLGTLDPYTILVEQEENAELQIMSSGKYGGLGMRIGLRSNWPTIVEPPFDGTPALKAGIREGDKVIEVDAESTKGMTISQVANLLRGEIGSKVFLKVVREGEDDPIEFRLIRAEIVVTDVVYSGMIEEGIGYIRLRRFSRNAGRDMRKSIRDLKKEGLQSLILDLRSNPGGLLEAAVNVSENFVEKEKLIVSTEGRVKGSVQKYFSERKPVLEELPLAVLVNGLSASASEIVAGAIQDLDRGVIIGRNTFGKGLVQTVVPLSNGAHLKITTAKYLIPSGRSIQDPNKFKFDSNPDLFRSQAFEQKDDGESEKNSEKVDEIFFTENGRKVGASHGIIPDIVLDDEPLSTFELELLRKTMLFQFAVVYAAQHPELDRDFEVTPEMLKAFKDFLRENEFEYESVAESALDEIEDFAESNQFLASASNSIDQLRSVILAQKKQEFENSADFIVAELKQEIAAKLWGTRAEIETTFGSDPAIQEAVSVLSDPERYNSILKIGQDEKSK